MPQTKFPPSPAKALIAVTMALILVSSALAAPKYKVLHAFSGTDGSGPQGRLVFDPAGNLYGATAGSTDSDGVVFQLTPDSRGMWKYSMLHSFQYKTDGGNPWGGLAIDAAGSLYGTTDYGGTRLAGTTFELTPGSNGWTFTVLIEFGSTVGGPILDAEGNLYGPIGGAAEVIHKPGGWKFKMLYPFCLQKNCQDGSPPPSGLSWDAAGNLYGTTETGGKSMGGDYGTAFQLEHLPDGSWKHHLLYSFPGFPGDGLYPGTGLVPDSFGNFFGTTGGGGAHRCGEGNCGVVFELSPKAKGGWRETIVHNAWKKTGYLPGWLVFDKAGSLYGVAGAGGSGACGCGLIFKLTPGHKGGWKYSVVYTFTGYDGAFPEGPLTMDEKGNFYGVAHVGGSGGGGVVYEITP